MNMTTLAPASSYTLHELDLYNWGAFGGRHQAGIDIANTAIIGPTGSGKTTLIDALMTLLCANPRYNLASTGGHESDRDLVSYVRGASGPGHSGDGNDHLARSGRSVTGIAARLVRTDGESVFIGALFWFDGSSSSASDMTRRWFFAQGPQHSLDLWLEEHHSGGARALGRLEKGCEGLQIFTSKSPYLARLQSFFEVGPNAFTLLNRAAGLKQLNSIDEIFRELVLDDQSAFDEAVAVADSFDQLASIHADLELANRQYLSLLPLRELARQEQDQQLHMQELRTLEAALPQWFATQGVQLWGDRAAQLQEQLERQQQQVDTDSSALDKASAHEQSLLEIYLRSGGGDIKLLEQSIATQEAVLGQKQAHLASYRKLARNLGLDAGTASLNASLLAQHQQQAQPALQQLEARQAELLAAAEDAVTSERNAHGMLQQLQTELHAVRLRPGSNLPTEFQQFRAALAQQLQRAPEDLPFVAELIEVQKNQQAWRGAIERAIGSQRLRIMVPPQDMQAALDWVNQRHNRLHVRLLEVRDPQEPVRFWDDGFCRLLNLKPHAYQSALRRLLADLDRHCVENSEALRRTPHAMTQQGLMSGKALHFDKQDHKRIDQDWMTGFDNRDRLAQLERQVHEQSAQWQALDQQKQAAVATHSECSSLQGLWHRLLELRFEDLDAAAIETRLQGLQSHLQALLDPQSDTAQAKKRWADAQKHRQDADNVLLQSRLKHAGLEERHTSTEKRLAEYKARLDPDAGVYELGHRLENLLPGGMPALDCDRLASQERHTLNEVYGLSQTQRTKLAELHKDIIRQMSKAQREDSGALAEQTQDIEALSHYLERLGVLEEEALPEKRQRFQDYLNTTSEQGVNALLSNIETQVTEITERIGELNRTLARVDFQPGRYLQLNPQPVLHQSLQDLHKALAELRSERLRDDEGRSHYQALRNMVELLREHAANRRTKAAQALLDARYRLQFAVQVLDRANGQVLERRTGSQGGSGGEKEIIASYVLTASLSYALCPSGRNRPVFGTIVLDEAFSKSSQAVAARIIQALREFGLHALFVTPNKELRLLRNHTRSAVVVHRRGQQATLASLSWQELHDRAHLRAGAQHAP
ncbi:ATP-binding protein [Delftia sp. NA_296.1]